MKLWDAAGGQELLTLKVPFRGILGLAFSPDVQSLVFSPDGKRLAGSGSGFGITIWDASKDTAGPAPDPPVPATDPPFYDKKLRLPKGPDFSRTDFKSVPPISVRLTAKKTTYVLDRQGMTAEKYREAIKEGKIAPPAIDLVLEITNTTKGDIDITVAGFSPRLLLDLKGKEGIEKRTTERPGNRTVRIILKPGQTHSLPITRLAGYSDRTTDDQLFWTEPGEYTLAASFETNIREPRSKDGVSGAFISKMKAYPAAPIKISVTLK